METLVVLISAKRLPKNQSLGKRYSGSQEYKGENTAGEDCYYLINMIISANSYYLRIWFSEYNLKFRLGF